MPRVFGSIAPSVGYISKAPIVVLAGTEGHENVGRIVNALETAKEFAETDGDEAELIFDGAGTQWIPELGYEDSDHGELYQAVRADASVWEFCSGAFGGEDAVADAGLVTSMTTTATRVSAHW